MNYFGVFNQIFPFSDVLYTCIFTENPYDVADKWLLNENLPLSYRQQIVEFILQNTGQKDFTPDPLFRDPYTGCKAECSLCLSGYFFDGLFTLTIQILFQCFSQCLCAWSTIKSPRLLSLALHSISHLL